MACSGPRRPRHFIRRAVECARIFLLDVEWCRRRASWLAVRAALGIGMHRQGGLGMESVLFLVKVLGGGWYGGGRPWRIGRRRGG